MNYLKLYIDFLKNFIKIERPIKVVFDCSNGTTGIILSKLFRKSKINAMFINDEPDGNFPAHGPNPLAKGATRQLEKEVRKPRRWVGAPTAERVGADLGVIFDADGDRVFFVDNRGRLVESHESGYILIQIFKPPYVAGIISSWRITKMPKIWISRVGHYFFKKLMREKKASLGVEHSGHYYFKKFFYCDSGILAAIEVINFVSGLKTDFASWLDKLPKYYRSGEINFEIRDKEKVLAKVERLFKKSAKKIIKMDGLTMEFSEWWFNLRLSNTENLIRLNLEAVDQKILKQKLKEIKKLVC